MPRFLVESYLSPAPGALEQASDGARQAAEVATSGGNNVRYLRTTLLRADETCFHMFDADSQEAMEAALESAGIAVERVAQAVERRGRGAAPNNTDGGSDA
jgi:hypothetical protein